MKKRHVTEQKPSTAAGAARGRKASRPVATAKGAQAATQKSAIRELFRIDLRSLALFRVLIALLLLVDLAIRSTDLNVMYTDGGMFPRAEIWFRVTSVWNWSLHFASGAAWYEGLLFAIAGLLALALMAGFWTRVATIGSWLLVVSLHHRVPAILSGAEILLRMLLFWSMFLPLGAVWSVDAWRARRAGKVAAQASEPGVVSVASIAILLQMSLMYFFSAIFKSNTQWIHGEALAGVLSHDFFTTPHAAWLLQFPGLLKLGTQAILILEWVAPLLLFIPKWTERFRLATIAVLALMHLGIAATLEVGLFSYVSLAGLCLFLTPSFWNSRLLARWQSRAEPEQVPRGQPAKTGKQPKLRYAAQGTCLLALLYVLALNLNSLPFHPLAQLPPQDIRMLRTGIGLSQSWGMFDAIPSMDGWYVAQATLRDGSVVDLLRQGAPVDWQRPAYPALLYKNYFWQKLFFEMSYFDEQGFQIYRAPVATYLCRNWNAHNPSQKEVANFEFIFCTADKQQGKPTSSLPISRRRLVRLDFKPGDDVPAVSGYDDAP